MAPRKTKHGASASARRTTSGGPRAASSSRSKSASKSGAPRTRKAAPKASKSRTTAHRTPARKAPARPGAQAPVSRWWILLGTVGSLVALFVWMYYPVAAVQYRETRERARLSAELSALQERNERLRKQVDRLKTPAGVEDYARSELGLVKRGENVVVVVDGDEGDEASKAAAVPLIDSDETTTTHGGSWTAFLDLVFGVR